MGLLKELKEKIEFENNLIEKYKRLEKYICWNLLEEYKNCEYVPVFRIEGGRLGKKYSKNSKIRKRVFVTHVNQLKENNDKEWIFFTTCEKRKKYLFKIWFNHLMLTLANTPEKIEQDETKYVVIMTKKKYIRFPKDEEKGGHNIWLDSFERVIEVGKIIEEFSINELLPILWTYASVKRAYDEFFAVSPNPDEYFDDGQLTSIFTAIPHLYQLFKKYNLYLPPFHLVDEIIYEMFDKWNEFNTFTIDYYWNSINKMIKDFELLKRNSKYYESLSCPLDNKK
jgi:hypothetical protein